MKLSKYIFVSTPVINGLDSDKTFVFSTRSSLSMLMSIKTLKELQIGDFTNISSEIKESLEKYKILVPKEENEFITILQENHIVMSGLQRQS